MVALTRFAPLSLPKGQVKCLDHDVDPYYCLWAIIRVRDESLGPEDEGLPILMRNGADVSLPAAQAPTSPCSYR